jgi:uncharacterized membrane protein YciS (DUF1049 family)
MVKGIVGLNGISLPLTAQSYLSYLPIDLAALGVTFQGMVPNQTLTMNPLLALLFIAVGQAIVWLLPNMHQIMSRYDIVVEDLAPKSKKMLAALAQAPKWWVWHPTMTGAVLIGLLFFSLIITMATNKPSTFLYYQL